MLVADTTHRKECRMVETEAHLGELDEVLDQRFAVLVALHEKDLGRDPVAHLSPGISVSFFRNPSITRPRGSRMRRIAQRTRLKRAMVASTFGASVALLLFSHACFRSSCGLMAANLSYSARSVSG